MIVRHGAGSIPAPSVNGELAYTITTVRLLITVPSSPTEFVSVGRATR